MLRSTDNSMCAKVSVIWILQTNYRRKYIVPDLMHKVSAENAQVLDSLRDPAPVRSKTGVDADFFHLSSGDQGK